MGQKILVDHCFYPRYFTYVILSLPKSSCEFKKITRVPNLYRRQATGVYYLRVKRTGREFRRSLRTIDFALAKRRLRDFEGKASRLQAAALARLRVKPAAQKNGGKKVAAPREPRIKFYSPSQLKAYQSDKDIVLVGDNHIMLGEVFIIGGELVRQYLSATGDARKVVTDAKAGYFGIEVNDQSLVPRDNPRLGPMHYNDWLKRSTA